MSHLVCSSPDCAGGGTVILIAGGDTYERYPVCENCFVRKHDLNNTRLEDFHIRGGDTFAPVKVTPEDAAPILRAAYNKLHPEPQEDAAPPPLIVQGVPIDNPPPEPVADAPAEG